MAFALAGLDWCDSFTSLGLKAHDQACSFGAHSLLERCFGQFSGCSFCERHTYNDRKNLIFKNWWNSVEGHTNFQIRRHWVTCSRRTKSLINKYFASTFAQTRLSFFSGKLRNECPTLSLYKKIKSLLSVIFCRKVVWNFGEAVKLITLLRWSVNLWGLIRLVHMSEFLSSYLKCTLNQKQCFYLWWCFRRENVNPSCVDKEKCDRISKYEVIRKSWKD